jgi:hypothetical protein
MRISLTERECQGAEGKLLQLVVRQIDEAQVGQIGEHVGGQLANLIVIRVDLHVTTKKNSFFILLYKFQYFICCSPL